MKQWKQREPAIPYNENDPIIRKLACTYGIKDAEDFMYPKEHHTNHYSLLFNIEEVVNLILLHIGNDHEIVLFVDIDHDGAASGAIMYRRLCRIHKANKIKVIHKQRDDGHGLNTAEDIVDENTKLLIAIDSSTNDVEACERIKNNGTDIIIIDHHTWEGVDNPHALIINPQMPDCNYPNKHLSGGMVAFKVCQALDDYLDDDFTESMVDLAGFSLLADSMSVLEMENRYYIDQALKNINNLGLKMLLNELKVDLKKIDSTKFSYNVSPCVSAITRENKFEKAINLYISDDPKECIELAKELVESNQIRKRKQKEGYQLIQNQINEEDKCIVVVEPSIGKSYNGLVAQLICEKYNRPAIVLGHKDEESKQYSGSFRSPEGFSMLDFMKTVKHSNYSGGHSEAGGTGCWKNRLKDFKSEINQKLEDHSFEEDVVYELEFDVEEINEQLINSINSFFRICGHGFKPAKIKVNNLFIKKKESLSEGTTLKAYLCAESETWFVPQEEYKNLPTLLTAMKFRIFDDFYDYFPENAPIEIIGTLNINEYRPPWNPRAKVSKTNQIFLEHFRTAN